MCAPTIFRIHERARRPMHSCTDNTHVHCWPELCSPLTNVIIHLQKETTYMMDRMDPSGRTQPTIKICWVALMKIWSMMVQGGLCHSSQTESALKLKWEHNVIWLLVSRLLSHTTCFSAVSCDGRDGNWLWNVSRWSRRSAVTLGIYVTWVVGRST